MKKTIIYLAFSGLLFFFFFQRQTVQQAGNISSNGSPALSDSSISFSTQVKGCAQKATRENTKFPGAGQDTEYPELSASGTDGILVKGDSVVYTRNVDHLCCRQVELSANRTGQVITITEYWHRQGCKCRCSSTVRLVMKQLPKGQYSLYGIETGTSPVDDKPVAGKDTVLQQVFTIQ